MIYGVVIKELTAHHDERGFFCEIIRASDPVFEKARFAQLSHSLSHEGVLKAWHLHKKQTDWMYTSSGDMLLGLYDTREGSPTYRQSMRLPMGEKYGRKVVRIPFGVAHGYHIIKGPMVVIYVMDKEYDPRDIAYIGHDDPTIGFDWSVDEFKY